MNWKPVLPYYMHITGLVLKGLYFFLIYFFSSDILQLFLLQWEKVGSRNRTYRAHHGVTEGWAHHVESWNGDVKDLRFIFEPMKGVVAFHILRRGGECSAAGVLMHFTRGHHWELPYTHIHKHTNVSWTGWKFCIRCLQLDINIRYMCILHIYSLTHNTRTSNLLHIPVRIGDFPVATIQLACALWKCWLCHLDPCEQM